MRIFVGYDSKYPHVYNTCKASIEKYSDVSVEPLILSDLIDKNLYWGNKKGSTEFSFIRFLVPYLCDFKGKAIFCDSDFLWTDNILKVLNFVDNEFAVSCVKHKINKDKLPKIKMDGQPQIYYPRKNWSSFMVFNCEHDNCKTLTPSYVSNTTGFELHTLQWAKDSIGSLPLTYNFLVGYYNVSYLPAGIHYTDGGPWLQEYANCEYSNLWFEMNNV